jgi:D-glycero-D-manno-heptose 1,7-bisphosphate phosphatase
MDLPNKTKGRGLLQILGQRDDQGPHHPRHNHAGEGVGVRIPEKATKLLVLDLDGTVRHGFDELGRFVNTAKDVVVFPEAVAKMREWKKQGGRIIGLSNQGGIAMGHVTMQQVAEAMLETQRQCSGLFDKISFCQHYPQAKDPEYARCWCRKPAPGGLIEAAIDLARSANEFYPPHLALMVGDREEDRRCAEIISFDFLWAKDWRSITPTNARKGWE